MRWLEELEDGSREVGSWEMGDGRWEMIDLLGVVAYRAVALRKRLGKQKAQAFWRSEWLFE